MQEHNYIGKQPSNMHAFNQEAGEVTAYWKNATK